MGKEQDEGLKDFIERLKKKFKPEKLLLFGSRARGDYLESSDWDILIVSKEFQNYSFRERIIKVYELVDKPLNVEVLCYTPEEFERRSKEFCIVKVAAEEGVPA